MISVETLKELLEYKEGALLWKQSKGHMKAGSVAGSITANGYVRVCVNRKTYLAHRLIFFMHHGYMPNFVDHIDCNKQNNKIENLREASMAENNRNVGLSKKNSSGVKGVSWVARDKKWRVQIRLNIKTISLGNYDDLKEAETVSIEARKLLHKDFSNHGRAMGDE